MKEYQDKVIIRRCKKEPKTLIAFFPDAEVNSGMILSYEHIGQHSEASLEFYYKDTKPLKESYLRKDDTILNNFSHEKLDKILKEIEKDLEELQDFGRELKSIGYNIKQMKRITRTSRSST